MRLRVIAGSLVALAAFMGLVAASPGGVYVVDSAGVSAEAWSLGVGRGMGAWDLLAKGAGLVPLGEVATRVHVLSALLGAVAAWAVYRAVCGVAGEDGIGQVAGMVAAVLAQADAPVWRACAVGAPAAATVAGAAIAMWLVVGATGDDAAARRRAGLGLALLIGWAWWWAPLGLVVAGWRLRRGDRWPLLAPAAFAVGAAVWLYGAIAATREMGAGVADPRTLGELWAEIAGAVRFQPAGMGRLLIGLEGDLGLPALAAAAAGLAVLIARRRAGVGIAAIYALVGGALVGNRALPGIALAIAAGVGIAAGARRMARGQVARYGGAVVVALGVVALVMPAMASDGRFALGEQGAAWARAGMEKAPPRALVLARSGELASALSYAQVVAGARPDVTVIERPELARGRYVARAVARGGRVALSGDDVAAWVAQPARSRSRGRRELLRKLIERALGVRAVLWEADRDEPPVGALVDGAVLGRVEAAAQPGVAARPLVEQIERLLGGSRDPAIRRLEAEAIGRLGASFAARGDDGRAGPVLDVALGIWPEAAEAAAVRAEVRARKGDLAGALRAAEAVLEREPGLSRARVDAGQWRLELGDLDGAEREFRKVQGEVEGLVGLGRVEHARGRAAEAKAWIGRAIDREPGDPDAREWARRLGM